MLAYYTPAPVKGIVRNEQLAKMWDEGNIAIYGLPAYYPDSFLYNHVKTDVKLMVYVAQTGVFIIYNVGGYKYLIASTAARDSTRTDLVKPKRKKKGVPKIKGV